MVFSSVCLELMYQLSVFNPLGAQGSKTNKLLFFFIFSVNINYSTPIDINKTKNIFLDWTGLAKI